MGKSFSKLFFTLTFLFESLFSVSAFAGAALQRNPRPSQDSESGKYSNQNYAGYGSNSDNGQSSDEISRLQSELDKQKEWVRGAENTQSDIAGELSSLQNEYERLAKINHENAYGVRLGEINQRITELEARKRVADQDVRDEKKKQYNLESKIAELKNQSAKNQALENSSKAEEMKSFANNQAEQCEAKTEDTLNACDMGKSSDLKWVDGLANTITTGLAVSTAASVQAACSGMGKLSQAANVAMTAYKGYCLASYTKCNSTCQDSAARVAAAIKDTQNEYNSAVEPNMKATAKVKLDQLKEAELAIKKSQRQCDSVQTKIASAVANIVSLVITAQNMKKCEDLALTEFQKLCKSNPTLPGCTASNVDCSNPSTAATNLVCICQSNPSNPQCGSGGSQVTNLNNKIGTDAGGGGGSGVDGRLGGVDGLAAGAPDFGGDPGMGGSAAGGNGKDLGNGFANSGRGGSGGGGFGSSGQNGSQAGRSGGKGDSGLNTKTISGYGYGGGGGGNYGYGGGSDRYGSSGGYGVGSKKVDLSAFLPGGKMDPSRGLAGISGPDGITGPNTDIWKKVNTRYYSVSPSLLP